MYKHFLVLLLFVFTYTAQAQERKDLNLETAVVQQYRALYPDRLSGVEWISPTQFTTIGDKGELMIRDVKGDTLKTIFPKGLNEKLADLEVDTIRSVRPYAWLNANTFVIRCGGDLVAS